jgi:DNA repair protein RadA
LQNPWIGSVSDEIGSTNQSVSTSNAFAKTTRNRLRVSTGSTKLDSLLGGGIETKSITQFYGPPGSGKSQICHTLSALVSSQEMSKDGSSCSFGKSIYIDTEHKFRPERIIEIAKARGFDPDKTLRNIIVANIGSSIEQDLILSKQFATLIKKNNVRLLIVDSPITNYKAEYRGRAMLTERRQKLYKFMQRLHEISQIYEIAVVVTDHLHDNTSGSKKPPGSAVMTRTITYGIHVHRLGVGLSCIGATMVASPYHQQNFVKFCITERR